MTFSFESRGGFRNLERFLTKSSGTDLTRLLNKYGQQGVSALQSMTPVESGLAASSWTFKVSSSATGASIQWLNTDIENGFPVAIMIQYGHGTGTGGYVQGIDYINPAMRPIFEQISNDIGKAVRAL